ncbi:MAG: hypothetical protein HN348_20655 [Proteobacteria bacterium]|jgi:hypothetical protein|nr:hypothetical protein [Pseudomonadota bacterium]
MVNSGEVLLVLPQPVGNSAKTVELRVATSADSPYFLLSYAALHME